MTEPVTVSELLKPLQSGDAVLPGWILARIEDDTSRLALRGPSDRTVEIAVLPNDRSGRCMGATATYQLVVRAENHQIASADEGAAFRKLLDIIRANDAGQPLWNPPVNGREGDEDSALPGNQRRQSADYDPRMECGSRREILLRIHSPCEMHCAFCDRGAGGPKQAQRLPDPLLRADYPALVRAARKDGRDWLTIGGDEPLTHPQLPEIVSTAHTEGFERIVIYTSGLALAAPGVAADLADRGVTYFELPIYALTAAVHDEITRSPGSHARLCQALEILRARRIPFGLHCVVLRSNLSELCALERHVFERFRIRLRIDQAFSRGGDLADYKRYAPGFAEICAVTHRSGLKLDRFPVCVARNALNTFEPTEFAPFFGPNGPEQHAHLPVCSPCRWKDRCPGPSRTYAAAYGDDGLSPEPDPLGHP